MSGRIGEGAPIRRNELRLSPHYIARIDQVRRLLLERIAALGNAGEFGLKLSRAGFGGTRSCPTKV